MTDLHDEQIRRLVRELVEAAPPAPPLPSGPAGGAMLAPPRNCRPRRRTAITVLAVAVVGAATATGIALTRSTHGSGELRTAAPPTTAPTPGTDPSTSAASAAELAHGRWVEMAPPPAVVGSGASVVWTGSRLIAWGGMSSGAAGVPIATGASYEPTTNTWTVLPPSPISGRGAAAVAWTGHEMVVWGGGDNTPGQRPHAADDGAAYDPTTRTWRRLPKSPLPASAAATALWADGEVVIIGGIPDGADLGRRVPTAAAAYRPATNEWRTLPDLPTRPDHDLSGVGAVTVGTKIVVFELWSHLTDLGNGSSSEAWGTDIYELNPKSGTWRELPTDPGKPPISVREPVSTGTNVIAFADSHCPVLCRGPFVFPATSSMYNPTTGSWQPMTPGPVDSGTSASAWTGAALIRFNQSTSIGNAGTGQRGSPTATTAELSPGEAAAWDPRTDSWTRLPKAPNGVMGARLVWTGHELLVWGDPLEPGSSQHIGYRYIPTR